MLHHYRNHSELSWHSGTPLLTLPSPNHFCQPRILTQFIHESDAGHFQEPIDLPDTLFMYWVLSYQVNCNSYNDEAKPSFWFFLIFSIVSYTMRSNSITKQGTSCIWNSLQVWSAATPHIFGGGKALPVEIQWNAKYEADFCHSPWSGERGISIYK